MPTRGSSNHRLRRERGGRGICQDQRTRDDVKANCVHCSDHSHSIKARFLCFFFYFIISWRDSSEVDQSITQASLVPGPPGPDVPPSAPAEEPEPDPIPNLDFDIDPSCPAPPVMEEPDDVALIEGWLRRIDPILSFFISRRWYTFRSSRYCRMNPS